MLTRRKESDTYLATASRYRWGPQIAMKADNVCSFQPALRPSSAITEICYICTFVRDYLNQTSNGIDPRE